MNVLSLFSGIGGLDLGIKIAVPEARVICHVEADRYCQRVLAARMSDGSIDPCPIWGDVRTFDGRPWRGCVDLIAGGFPCQDISNAGRRAGIGGGRSGLWSEFARLVGEVRPRYVFVENVGALLVRGVDVVLGDLASLGYDAEWLCLSAAEVGAPHLRKRVFILAHAQDGYDGGTVADPCRLQPWQQSERGGVPSPGRAWDGVENVADAQRPERRQDAFSRCHSLQGCDGEGQAAGGAGERGFSVADAQEQCGELRATEGERSGRPASGNITVGDADLKRLEGTESLGERIGIEPFCCNAGVATVGDTYDEGLEGRCVCQQCSGDERSPRQTGLPRFPPGPGDRDAWRAYLEAFPHLEPSVRRGSDGLSHRVDRLRSLGNAVVPLQAAAAFTILFERLKKESEQ